MSDIADILASELHDVDLVPSDIAVGLILLQDEQEREQAERRSKGEVRNTKAAVNKWCPEDFHKVYMSVEILQQPDKILGGILIIKV